MGINQYAQPLPNVMLRTVPNVEYLERFASELEPAGIIAQAACPEAIAILRQLGLPTVNVSAAVNNDSLPAVRPDHRAIGGLVAEHFLSRGLRHFACLGTAHYYSELRLAGFRARLQQEQLDCETLIYERDASTWVRELSHADLREQRIAWLRNLPEPVGLLCVGDQISATVVELCATASIRVPDQLALVSVDNTPFICEATHPAISSVDLNGRQVGFEATKLLCRLIAGEPAPTAPILIPPKTLVVRTSSDTYALGDKRLVKAVRYLHEHCGETLYVDAVVRRSGTSLRMLQRLFMQQFGHSLMHELLRIRTERARRLIIETDMLLSAVAQQAGFLNQQYFTNVFTRLIGEPPGRYRRRHRLTQ
jgi:LacI family transcriptional regulator